MKAFLVRMFEDESIFSDQAVEDHAFLKKLLADETFVNALIAKASLTEKATPAWYALGSQLAERVWNLWQAHTRGDQ